jgi:hypothetical protein
MILVLRSRISGVSKDAGPSVAFMLRDARSALLSMRDKESAK